MHLGGRSSKLVELLDGGRHGRAFVRTGDGRLGLELHALDDPSAPDLEDLHHDAGGSQLESEHVTMTELGGRHLLLAIVERLDGPHGVTQSGRLLEALGAGGLAHPALEGLGQLVVPTFEEQLRQFHGAAVHLG